MTAGSRYSIWYFIGILLTFYGVIIAAMGLYSLYSPPNVKLAEYHADLWWGLLLLAIGGFYVWHFSPSRVKPREPVAEF
ncbi:hypothetical protein OJF2_48650 [Aquisphaera giovannonii]|uniref:Uncharacterized protein n=1 Tax=Aquisphaera giovannonii TaxID=406548 RepID=A0A5B9W7U0_9BACT|nr:hypothetical protein [Aquisphaera giovannonii]QEH36304.1 hypothetical protein OJF2_48650 [Aquisphaera giovannonii]